QGRSLGVLGDNLAERAARLAAEPELAIEQGEAELQVRADRLVGPLGEPELVEGPGAERAGLLLEELAGEQEVVAEPAGVDDDARDSGQHDAREQAARPGARGPGARSRAQQR